MNTLRAVRRAREPQGCLLAALLVLVLAGCTAPSASERPEIVFFSREGCDHCSRMKEALRPLLDEYSGLAVRYVDFGASAGKSLLQTRRSQPGSLCRGPLRSSSTATMDWTVTAWFRVCGCAEVAPRVFLVDWSSGGSSIGTTSSLLRAASRDGFGTPNALGSLAMWALAKESARSAEPGSLEHTWRSSAIE